MGWKERIAEAGNEWGAVLVDKDVYLTRVMNISRETRAGGMEEWHTVRRFPWTTPKSCMRPKARATPANCRQERLEGEG